MRRTVLFTADDLGLDETTNLAIERAHRLGALTTASLMPGQTSSTHALEVARRNPLLQIGWHLHVCDSHPITCERWPWGKSPILAGIALASWPPARALVRRELQTQWNWIAATGLPCRFINGHHHMHIHPFIASEVFKMVSASFAGWVRGFHVKLFGSNRRCHLGYQILRHWSANWLNHWPTNRLTNSLWGLDRLHCMNAAEVVEVLPTLPQDGIHEFLFHPRRGDDLDQRALLNLPKIV